MKIKKFICHQCGAPKTSKYDGIFIYCDYCSCLTDIDFQRHIQVFKQDSYRVDKWQSFIIDFETACNKSIETNDKKTYRRWQYDYLNTYARLYLYALPPELPKGEERNLFLRTYADIMTELAFSEIKNSPQFLKYMEKRGTVRSFEDFASMIESYLVYLQTEARFIYDNEKYIHYTKYWPEYIYTRSKLFELITPWIERAEPGIMLEFLKKYNLHEEFVELQEPVCNEKPCENCGKLMSVPIGAVRQKCKNCKHENHFKTVVNCHSCGQENKIPSKWTRTLTCVNCNTLLKVVTV